MRPALILLLLAAAVRLNLGAAGLNDNFDTAPAGVLPPGWDARIHGTGQPHWALQNEGSAPNGSQVLKQTGWMPNSSYPVCVNTNLAARLQDGFVEVRFRPESGTNDQAAGVVWRFQDIANYYVARANAMENNVVLYKVENGKRTSLDIMGRQGGYGVKANVPAKQWSTLRVDFAGPLFRVRLNGENLFIVKDSTFTQPGQVGLWTKADSVTSFDDFRCGLESK